MDRLILPAETLYISVPVSAAWFFLFYLANAVDMRKRHIVHTTFHLFFWEHRFYGLAGLVSMPEALLAADGLAVHAFLTTNTSAACGLLSWMAIDMIRDGKPTVVGACTGAVLGLVAITPGAGFVPLWSAFIIGIVVSPICYFMMSVVKKHFGYDDALDAFGCHGIGGVWGGIATGIFAQKSINSTARWDGLVFGDYHLFVAQLISIVITIAVAIVGTLICAGIVKLFTPLRVSEHDERIGLDESQHGESAYPSFNGLD